MVVSFILPNNDFTIYIVPIVTSFYRSTFAVIIAFSIGKV